MNALVVAGGFPPLPLLLMEDALKKTYRYIGCPRVTLAGIGKFAPFFVANTVALQEKIENSVWFSDGRVILVSSLGSDGKPESIPAPIERPQVPEVVTMLSRRSLYLQQGVTKINEASLMDVQVIAMQVGATEDIIATLGRVDLMRFIRDRTIK